MSFSCPISRCTPAVFIFLIIAIVWSFLKLDTLERQDFILSKKVHIKPELICGDEDSRDEFLSYLGSVKDHLRKKCFDHAQIEKPYLSPELILATIDEIIDFCRGSVSIAEVEREFNDRFTVLRVNRLKHRVFFTAYFMPEISASFIKKEGFTYPIYAKPPELKRFFDKEGARTKWGLETEDGYKPYHTRYEIDFEESVKDLPVLAWVPTPVEGLLIHIQGSSILNFGGGIRKSVRYSADNGHPYKSICRYFMEKNLLKRGYCTWEDIERIWREKPMEFKEATKINPRYIFFEFSDELRAVGGAGHYLLGKKVVALDNDIYPYGLLVYIKGKSVHGLMVNLDKGVAIKGHGRVDVYLGEGFELVKKAQSVKEEGEMYIILKKDPLLEGVKGWR